MGVGVSQWGCPWAAGSERLSAGGSVGDREMLLFDSKEVPSRTMPKARSRYNAVVPIRELREQIAGSTIRREEKIPTVVVSIEDIMAKEVRECSARGRGGGKEGDGDRELEAIFVGDLESFEEGTRNDASCRWWRRRDWRKMRDVVLRTRCKEIANLLGIGFNREARRDAEESEGKSIVMS
ncbi:hypothetical protein BHM03_00054410 [Ensete ventricosum]|nr:hypothetical protein BHM03_00054410 [Ensete ventricosum]